MATLAVAQPQPTLPPPPPARRQHHRYAAEAEYEPAVVESGDDDDDDGGGAVGAGAVGGDIVECSMEDDGDHSDEGEFQTGTRAAASTMAGHAALDGSGGSSSDDNDGNDALLQSLLSAPATVGSMQPTHHHHHHQHRGRSRRRNQQRHPLPSTTDAGSHGSEPHSHNRSRSRSRSRSHSRSRSRSKQRRRGDAGGAQVLQIDLDVDDDDEDADVEQREGLAHDELRSLSGGGDVSSPDRASVALAHAQRSRTKVVSAAGTHRHSSSRQSSKRATSSRKRPRRSSGGSSNSSSRGKAADRVVSSALVKQARHASPSRRRGASVLEQAMHTLRKSTRRTRASVRGAAGSRLRVPPTTATATATAPTTTTGRLAPHSHSRPYNRRRPATAALPAGRGRRKRGRVEDDGAVDPSAAAASQPLHASDSKVAPWVLPHVTKHLRDMGYKLLEQVGQGMTRHMPNAGVAWPSRSLSLLGVLGACRLL